MGRAKGSPKTGGRAKGTPNKTTAELKKLVHDLVSANIESFIATFNTIDKDLQFAIILRLLPYVLPKQTENKISLDDDLLSKMKDSMEEVNDLFK